VEKYREVIPLGPKVITANTVNVKPILGFLLLEIVGGTPVNGEMCVSKPLPFSSMCEHLRGQDAVRAEIWPPKKLNLGW